jgi:hypothetical protein
LPALEDRFDQLWAQERNVNEAPNVAPGDAIAVGQILERPGAARRFLLIGSGVLAAVPLIIRSQTGAAPRAAGVIHKQSALRRSEGLRDYNKAETDEETASQIPHPSPSEASRTMINRCPRVSRCSVASSNGPGRNIRPR